MDILDSTLNIKIHGFKFIASSDLDSMYAERHETGMVKPNSLNYDFAYEFYGTSYINQNEETICISLINSREEIEDWIKVSEISRNPISYDFVKEDYVGCGKLGSKKEVFEDSIFLLVVSSSVIDKLYDYVKLALTLSKGSLICSLRFSCLREAGEPIPRGSLFPVQSFSFVYEHSNF